LVAKSARVAVESGLSEQSAVYREEQFSRDRLAGPDSCHAVSHGFDVCQHLDCRGVGLRLVERPDYFGSEQSSSTNLQTFYSGRSHGFSTQQ
jgi:hypothetical protein